MNANSKNIEKLNTLALDVNTTIDTTSSIMDVATHSSEQMVDEYTQTRSKIDHVVKQINDIHINTYANTKSIEEIGSTAHHLSSLTEKLTFVLEKFKTHV